MGYSYSENVDASCPRCGAGISAVVWLSVDLQERPDLAEQLREGQLSSARCPRCSHTVGFSGPLLVCRPGQAPPLILCPDERLDLSVQEQFGYVASRAQQSAGLALPEQWTARGIATVTREHLSHILAGVEMVAIDLGSDDGPLTRDLNRLISGNSLPAARSIVEGAPHLLDAEADRFLASQIAQAHQGGEDQKARALTSLLIRLRRCRMLGVESAFAELEDSLFELPKELIALIAAIDSFDATRDPDRLLELVSRARFLMDRELQSELWALAHGQLAKKLLATRKGDHAERVEQGIDSCNEALSALRPEDDSTIRGDNLNMLGNLLLERVRGDLADNFDEAIENYRKALELRPRESMPERRAETENNLGIAYAGRIQGDRAENLEQAIAHYERSLELYDSQRHPFEWARTHSNLVSAYRHRILGSHAQSLEKAIHHGRKALGVYGREDYPLDWAMVNYNLAGVHAERILGERADNLEKALHHARSSLEIYNQEDHPIAWAKAQNTLGGIYLQRLNGDRTENLEEGIFALERALEVRARDDFPRDWATTLTNLASAYSELKGPDREENLERAIDHYRSALAVHTREAFPERWAGIHNNLTGTYGNRIRGDHGSNIERAIEHGRKALTVYSRNAFPREWAQQHLNLGNAFAKKSLVDRGAETTRAPEHYRKALEIFKLDELPSDHLTTQSNLGIVLFREGTWAAAEAAFESAIQAGDLLFREAYTDIGRRSEINSSSTLFPQSAYCLLRLGRFEQAFMRLEQGKGRLLAEALALREIDLSLLPEDQSQTVRSARQIIRTLEAQLRQASGDERVDERGVAEALRAARAELKGIFDVARRQAPDFWPTELDLETALPLIPEGGALVAPVVTSAGSAAFVVPGGARAVTGVEVVWIDDFNSNDLGTLMGGDPSAEEGWLRAYLGRGSKLDRWLATIDATAHALWSALVSPIHARLQELGLAREAPVLILPQGALSILPLHAAWRTEGGQKRTLLDDFTVSFAPSLRAHEVSRRRLEEPRRQGRSLIVVVDPTDDLKFSSAEGKAVAARFPAADRRVLAGSKATPDAFFRSIPGRNYVHFCCHGFYDWQEAMRSGLLLSGSYRLTLAEVIGKLDLDLSRLATLSACETGLSDFRHAPDEYLGLPAGFLQAGAPAVISTLWAVADLSTMLLMERFYQGHLDEGLSLPAALRAAQLWLRDLPAGELSESIRAARQGTGELRIPAAALMRDQIGRFTALDDGERPFSHPFYWAAFILNGL